MEFSIISKETIKPSSTFSIHGQNPFKLSLIDQVTPTTYAPLILFYSSKNNKKSSINQLKTSLSETLTRLYPFSGRLKNNYFIDDFDRGISYVESRVSCRLSDFLQQPQINLLNNFLPCRPFCHEFNSDDIHQIAIQVTVFDCGGMAIGYSMNHKIGDGAAASYFLNCWASVARRSTIEKDSHVFEASSSLFLPRDTLPDFHKHFWERIWFSKCKLKTKRFVFGAQAISALRAKARSEQVEYPTRIEALTAFIWKSAMSASRKMFNSPPTLSMLCQIVNLRKRAKPCLSNDSIENLFSTAIAKVSNCTNEETTRMPVLVKRLRESVSKIDNQYIKSLQGYNGLDVLGQHMTELDQILVNENAELFVSTSWLKFGFDKLDFGWGAPIWVGVQGEAGSEIMNLIIFKESAGNDKGIEAWITLEENVMGIMEEDPKFLEFASSNPPISIMP